MRTLSGFWVLRNVSISWDVSIIRTLRFWMHIAQSSCAIRVRPSHAESHRYSEVVKKLEAISHLNLSIDSFDLTSRSSSESDSSQTDSCKFLIPISPGNLFKKLQV